MTPVVWVICLAGGGYDLLNEGVINQEYPSRQAVSASFHRFRPATRRMPFTDMEAQLRCENRASKSSSIS